MCKYRTVQVNFWRDEFLFYKDAEYKYFYMYLLTNPACNQAGIYTLLPEMAALELGFSVEKFMELLKLLEEDGKILYSQKTKEIMVVNWYKYNLNINNKNTRTCINTCLKEVKEKKFVSKLFEFCMADENVATCDIKDMFINVNMGDNESALEKLEEKKSHNEETPNTEEVSEDKKQEIIISEEFKSIIDFFHNNFHMITPVELDKLNNWLKDMDSSLILKAMTIAVEKNARNIAYVSGILQRWYDAGVRNEDDFKEKIEGARVNGTKENSKDASLDNTNSAAYTVINEDISRQREDYLSMAS